METPLDALDLTRFEDVIRGYEARPEAPGQVLLYGSSFLFHWGYETAKRQWSEATDGALSVVNHGFGGATVDELLYYYPRMARPFAPSASVLRPGLNDLRRGFTPEEAWFLTQRLVTWLRTDFPAAPAVILQIFDTPCADEAMMERYRAYNLKAAEYAAGHPGVYALDLSPFFHEDPSQCGTLEGFRDVFIEDGLHLKQPLYADMAAYLAPKVAEILRKERGL